LTYTPVVPFRIVKKTGFRNLDTYRMEEAKQLGLTHLEKTKEYRLPAGERMRRVQALFEGLAHLEGGAKQSLHYTDVMPSLVVSAVTKGGNHIFSHLIGAEKGRVVFNIDAFQESLTVFADELLSPVYVGWAKGYLAEQRASFAEFAATEPRILLAHPRQAYQALIADLRKPENAAWLA
jgi:CRISPR-associated protein Cst2